MSAAVDPRRWLIGPLAPYAQCVLLEQDGSPEFAAQTLLSTEGIAAAMAAYAARHPGAPKRALVSQWSKRYFASLLIPLAPLLLAGWRLPQSLDDVSLRLNEHGEVHAFRYCHAGHPLGTDLDTHGRWHELLFQHLTPLIAALARHGKISQRVLWNNVGNLLETIFVQLGKMPGATAALAEDSVILLEAAHWPDGSGHAGVRNPMRHPVHYVDPLMPEVMPEPTRLRRHCCLRHEIPGIVYCATCPHLADLGQAELHILLERWHHED